VTAALLRRPAALAEPREAAAPVVRPFTVTTAVVYLGFHAVLGVAGYRSATIATLHAAVVALLLFGHVVWSRRIERIVALTAYAALCDVFWRMTQSRAPWEFSKYLLVVGSVAVVIRFVRPLTHAIAPLAFLALLLPGILRTVITLGPTVGRAVFSDSEMGLIALGVAALAFRQLVATETDAWNVCWTMLGPLVAALAITTWATLTTVGLTFTDESNFAVTGGFGPNQVSTALGLAILLCLLLAFQRRGPQYLAVLIPLGLWCLWGGLLTFSRGGIYSVVLAGGAMLVVGVATRGARVRSLVTLAVAVAALFFVFASVNDFTGNTLDSRYSEGGTSTAGRTNLALEDLRVFGANPLVGVGSGQSPLYHSGGILSGAAAHTEYTRVVAEHGALGAIALTLLVGMAFGRAMRTDDRWNRLMVAGCSAWALTTMFHAATRLGAVSLLFALGQLRVEPDRPAARR
jgi:hypothetical protein